MFDCLYIGVAKSNMYFQKNGNSEGEGGSRLWNSEGMGGNAFWNFRSQGGVKT